MNGSEGNEDYCSTPGCKTTRCHTEDSCYDRIRFTGATYKDHWYCDSCWAVLTGKYRVETLERENADLKRRVTWFEKLMKPGLWACLFRRITMRKSLVERMDNALSMVLNHAGSAIECVDEPGKEYLREICEIVDGVYGIDTSEEQS